MNPADYAEELFTLKVNGVVEPGYQVASGNSPTAPYPDGSIKLQTPYFKKLGLDLTPFYSGTLNVDIAPYEFQLNQPEYTFKQVAWIDTIEPEDFSFTRCIVAHKGKNYFGLVYYPHPESKAGHFQKKTLLEIICQPIENMEYGASVTLRLKADEITLKAKKKN